MRNKRAWFYLVVWKSGFYAYFPAKEYKKHHFVKSGVVSISKAYKAYTDDCGFKIPVNYTARVM